MSDGPDTLLEGLLQALTDARGDLPVLFRILSERFCDHEVGHLIAALWQADEALRQVFSQNGHHEAEAALARTAAHRLSEAANTVLAAEPGRTVRFGDITL